MLKPKEINLLRDAAVQLELHDLQMAHDLMALAHQARPNGLFIKEKLKSYQKGLNFSDYQERQRLQNLVNIGELAIIPIGFRCHTKQIISKRLGIKQASLPFDSGFFSPDSVASILLDPKIDMSFEGFGQDHSVCLKTEDHIDSQHGIGIKFDTSNYEYINNSVLNKKLPDINKYLDSTFGYYTLNIKHQFVLAHYNWHPLSSDNNSKGVTNPKDNIININNLLKKRILRMQAMIEQSKHVIFIFAKSQKYKYIQIDGEFVSLSDFEFFNSVCSDIMGDKYTLIENFNDENLSARNILGLFEEKYHNINEV